MIAALLGLLAAGIGVATGAPWWSVFASVPFFVPGRIGPAVGAVCVLALLPWEAGPLWRDLLLVTSGVLAGWAVLYRIGHAVAWVAVPWWIAGFLLLAWAWTVLPPAGYWSGSDVAVRARMLTLAAFAAVGLAVHYFPRYLNDAPPVSPGAAGGTGTVGGRDDMR